MPKGISQADKDLLKYGGMALGAAGGYIVAFKLPFYLVAFIGIGTVAYCAGLAGGLVGETVGEAIALKQQ